MVVSPLPLLESPDTTSCILSHPITSSTCFNATISKVETTPFPSNGPILGTNHPAEWNTAALDDRSIIIPSDDPACVSATPHTLTTQKCHVKTRQSQTEHHRRNVNKAIDASVSHRNGFYIHGNRIQQNSSNKNIKSTTRRASSANTTLSGRSCIDSGRGVRYLGDKRKPPDLPLVNRAPTDECFDMPELVIHWEAIQCGNPISDVHLSASATDVVN
ncbi:hypothetical protein BASA61_006398 [Batrachochytrium salamandrivorans]|nr:hypothetical protein BASA61_006398 [Batrachochytrium salamandrivorans]